MCWTNTDEEVFFANALFLELFSENTEELNLQLLALEHWGKGLSLPQVAPAEKAVWAQEFSREQILAGFGFDGGRP